MKKELNVKTRILPRSSFCSVPFEKKELLKKRNLSFSGPLPSLWMPGYDNQFASPTFLFSHAVTSSKHVAQEKIISWNRFLFY